MNNNYCSRMLHLYITILKKINQNAVPIFVQTYIIQIVHGIEGHLAQSSMNYLLYNTQPTNTTSIRTQLDDFYMNIFNTNTKIITKTRDIYRRKNGNLSMTIEV